jgi:hypothetical protein
MQRRVNLHSVHIRKLTISINRTSPCAADNNELEAFDMTDSWCCYVGNEEELHVLALFFTGFFVGVRF